MRGSEWLSSQVLNTWESSPCAQLAPEQPLWIPFHSPQQGMCSHSLKAGPHPLQCPQAQREGAGGAEQCRRCDFPVDEFLPPPRAAQWVELSPVPSLACALLI